ncbi:MAG: GNAT family N-acetyltransferase [Acidimicrobiia bacterium]|nr:GNAT family N-acetyltransferase [Acidimicrobiia bacterium]
MIETRPTKPAEYRQAANALCASYLQEPPTDERWAKSLPSWQNMISYSSWDGECCVGHAGYHAVETTVPGGARLETAAITRVGLVPTHTRMGLGTALMEALIADSVERNLPLTSLRASEAVIYRRYGYGVAGDFTEVAIDPIRARPVAGVAAGHRYRILTPEEIMPVTTEIDTRSLGSRPGLITRPDTWRRYHFDDAIEQSTGAFVAVHLDRDGQPDGYTHYQVTWGNIFEAGGTGNVKDVAAISDDVELALWSYLFDVDLVRSWQATRPIDDLAQEAVHDRRAYKIRAVNDEQWLRLLDVDTALSARTYNPVAGSVVIEISDPLIIANNGRWRISGEGAERCEDSADLEADVEAGIDSISALYLGAGSWHTEAAVGRVAVTRPGGDRAAVLTRCDQLFSHKPLPFCGTFF